MAQEIDFENIEQTLVVRFAYNERTFRAQGIELGDVVKAFIDVTHGMKNEDIGGGVHTSVQPGPRMLSDGVELTEPDDFLVTATYVTHKASVIQELDARVIEAMQPFREAGGALVERVTEVTSPNFVNRVRRDNRDDTPGRSN